jgi:MFS family permease
MLSQAVRPERRGAAFGWNASLRVFGGMGGALMGGVVIALAGTRGVFVFAGLLLFIMILPVVIFVPKVSRFIQEK